MEVELSVGLDGDCRHLTFARGMVGLEREMVSVRDQSVGEGRRYLWETWFS